MAEQETIADIIAEKRARADEIERDVAEKMKRGEMISDRYARELVADMRAEADRLEAAWKREKAAAENSSAVGNCAKQREALKRIVAASIVAKDANAPEWILQRMADIFATATVALAAPPRNCDEMPNIDHLTVHDLAKSPCKSTLECASREELLALVRWLLAPAAEQKGGAK